MARTKTEKPLTEAKLIVLLKERFAAPEFAFLPHVRNGTGYARGTTRTADALAMSLWPSRGLELYGFEIKSERRDWLRERENPEKAEEICRFCDRWWVVAGVAEGGLESQESRIRWLLKSSKEITATLEERVANLRVFDSEIKT